MIKCAFTWKWYKKVLKMHKKFFAIRIWKRKAPETLFFATMIFKYGKMILNWFTFLHVINAFALISFRAIKIHFSVQKDDDDIFLMEIASSYFAYRAALSIIFFNLFIFNGRFSTFSTRKVGGWGSAIKENSWDAYLHWKLFFSLSLCINIRFFFIFSHFDWVNLKSIFL